MFRPLVIAAAVMGLLAGCSKQGSESAAPATAGNAAAVSTAGAPAAPVAPAAPSAPAAPAAQAPQGNEIFSTAPAPAQQAPARNVGKVLQLQNGGGYSYAEVQTAAGQKVWIAGSQIDIKPGAEVQWGNYGLMRDFPAKSINRTFAEILFVDRWAPVGQAPVAVAPHGKFPNGQPAMSADEMAAAAAGGPGAAADPSSRGTVKTVTNAGGYSYIEVDQGGKTIWVAAMETPMKTGDKVQWQGGTQMSNFTAKSLNRTFDKIVFAQTVSVGK